MGKKSEYPFYSFWSLLGNLSQEREKSLLDKLDIKKSLNSRTLLLESVKRDYAIEDIVISPTYFFLDQSFENDFREPLGKVIVQLKNESEEIISRKLTTKVLYSGFPFVPVINADSDDTEINFILKRDEKIRDLVKKMRNSERETRDAAIRTHLDDYNSVVCTVHTPTKSHEHLGISDILFQYLIAKKSELRKKVRLPIGYEQRQYQVVGKTGQLDTLEKMFSYMEMLGRAGHSSGIKIDYDGDGDAKLRFKRKDRRKNLNFPAESLLLSKEIDGQSQPISPEEFLALGKKHRGYSWRENGKKVCISSAFNESDYESFVIN